MILYSYNIYYVHIMFLHKLSELNANERVQGKSCNTIPVKICGVLCMVLFQNSTVIFLHAVRPH